MSRSPASITDELLILRCQQGEAEAIEELIRHWQPRLLRHAYRHTQSPESARDVCQNAWLAIVGSLHTLQDPVAFPNWAYQIVGRKSVDWIRQQQKHRNLLVKRSRNQAEIDTPEESSQETDALRRALRELPCEQHQILTMFYLDELSVEEISLTLAIPRGTVKSRLHYARQQLKTLLERQINEST